VNTMVYIPFLGIDIGTMKSRMGIIWLMQTGILSLMYMRRLLRFRYLAVVGRVNVVGGIQ
jgi:hypothetical protein